jgi:D-alanine-D-alanine ligase
LRCDEHGRPQLMEINPLAGLHPTHSDLPILWTAIGREYVNLIGSIVDSARLRIADFGLRIRQRKPQSAIRDPR